MSADMLVAWIPKFELTVERRTALMATIQSLSETELEKIRAECTENSREEGVSLAETVTSILMDCLEEVFNSGRDVTDLELPGLDYAVLMTGGESNGEPPTSAFTYMSDLGYMPVTTWILMTGYAREDYAKLTGKTTDPEESPLRQHVKAVLKDMRRIAYLHAVGDDYYVHGRLRHEPIDTLCKFVGLPSLRQMPEENHS